MNYKTEEFKMSDGNTNIVHIWLPDAEPKAVLLLSHGMVEHMERYERLAGILCAQNIALYGEDHRGHGKTAALAEKNGTGLKGYLAPKNGFFRVIDDIHEEALVIRERHPAAKIILLGHSFGSFIAQGFIESYADSIDLAVICGSAGPRQPMVKFGKAFANTVAFFNGRKKTSKFIDDVTFGSYSKKVPKEQDLYKKGWLTRDLSQIEKYNADPDCGFICTAQFYCDMLGGLSKIHTKKAMKKIPADLPVYIIAGTDDPVGNYGKSVKDLYNVYNKNGIKDLTLKLYEGARHELFNETNKEEVEKDLVDWIDARL